MVPTSFLGMNGSCDGRVCVSSVEVEMQSMPCIWVLVTFGEKHIIITIVIEVFRMCLGFVL